MTMSLGELNNVCACGTFGRLSLNTNDLVCVGYTFKTKRCGKLVISSIKITEKFHGQCFWLLTMARGVVLNDHLKMLELFMFVTGQYSLNLFVLRHIFVREFTHCQFLCVTEILYVCDVCWLKLFWTYTD